MVSPLFSEILNISELLRSDVSTCVSNAITFCFLLLQEAENNSTITDANNRYFIIKILSEPHLWEADARFSRLNHFAWFVC